MYHAKIILECGCEEHGKSIEEIVKRLDEKEHSCYITIEEAE